MATQLIKHLKNCAENDIVYKPLNSQWAFDEPLIAKALQNVSVYFPHYSRHDESHSRQILVHIERLLGEDNILKLTATDTWLLLEAAYLHDIGMIVSDDQLNKDFEAIKKHVEKTRHLANGETLIIMDALLASKTNTASAVFATVDFSPLHTVKLLREIIADFYRSKHPERANTITSNPMEIGLNSPRTELIPARLFGLLGKICAYHGSSFEQVMQLPKQQVGIGTDDCHPRFIACLLRLGDLLDLDDNRFCPVMMKMAGELPETSKAHYDKHLAIRLFRADSDRIEIEADCPSYESYIETTQWFGWLRDEVKNQMSRWFDIVPSRNFGLLPSVGDLKAHLQDWQVFSEDQRPQFNLDKDSVFELLQGAGLYDCKEQAMRELLQNAVDATLLRIWREHGEDCTLLTETVIKRDSAPRSEEVRKILNHYSIDVSIEKVGEENQYNYWRITIADQGAGISKEDLKFLMQLGSSKKNSQRRAVIEKMSIWMKPSGIFGIGLHSVFLLTEEVIIETRSIDTGEILVIRLTNPTNKTEHGNIYFQVITEPRTIEFNSPYEKNREFNPWDFSRYGCRLSFIYQSDKSLFSKKSKTKFAGRAFEKHDGLIDKESDFNILIIEEEIDKFFNIPLLAAKITKIDCKNNIYWLPINNAKSENYYFSCKQELEIKIADINIYENRYQKDETQDNIEETNKGTFSFDWKIDQHTILTPSYYDSLGHLIFFYRGQLINDQLFFFNLLSVAINLLDEEADKILSINRNTFRKGTRKDGLFSRVSNAVQEFFKNIEGKNYYQRLKNDADRAVIAAEYELQGWIYPEYFTIKWDEVLISVFIAKNWQDIKLKDLAKFNTVVMFSFGEYYSQLQYLSEEELCPPEELLKDYVNNSCAVIDIESTSDLYIARKNKITVYTLINKFLKTKGFSSIYCDDYLLLENNKTEKPAISEYLIILYCKRIGTKDNWLKRESIPILSDKYKELELFDYDHFTIQDNRYPIQRAFELDQINPRMLFPLARIHDMPAGDDSDILDVLARSEINVKITVGNLDILAKRVYENRADQSVTEQQIKEKYQEFIAFLDDLMKDDAEWKNLRGDEFKLVEKNPITNTPAVTD